MEGGRIMVAISIADAEQSSNAINGDSYWADVLIELFEPVSMLDAGYIPSEEELYD